MARDASLRDVAVATVTYGQVTPLRKELSFSPQTPPTAKVNLSLYPVLLMGYLTYSFSPIGKSD